MTDSRQRIETRFRHSCKRNNYHKDSCHRAVTKIKCRCKYHNSYLKDQPIKSVVSTKKGPVDMGLRVKAAKKGTQGLVRNWYYMEIKLQMDVPLEEPNVNISTQKCAIPH